jgi:hypothetical protein
MAKNKVVAYFYDEEIGYVPLATLNVKPQRPQASAAVNSPALAPEAEQPCTPNLDAC